MLARYVLVVLAVCSLACSGASEKVFRWTTGGEIEETEDGGAEVRLPGGIRVSVDTSGDVPSTFPMPPPWDGARPESATTTRMAPEDEPVISLALSYPLERPADDVAKVYERWMKRRLAALEKRSGKGKSGWKYSTRSKSIVPGLRFTKLTLEEKEDIGPPGLERFEVLITQGFGIDSLSVTHSVLGARQFPSSVVSETGGDEAVESKKALSSD